MQPREASAPIPSSSRIRSAASVCSPRGAVERPKLRAEAHQNAIEHRMVERRAVGLRNIRKFRRQCASGIVPHVAARDFDAAALRLQKAKQAAEQCALSHAVRAEHGNALAPVRTEADTF